MFLFGDKSILGIDIGTADIKIAQITHRSDKKVLDTYGIVNLSYQITARDSDAVIAQTATILKTLLKQADVTSKHCVISLPNSAVFTSVIDMPKMPDRELEQALQFEAKKYVPLPQSEVILSWSIIEANAKTNTNSVLLTAVPKHIRESYVKLFAEAGLELEIIEIEALALIRSLIFDNTTNNVIIDIGAKTTGISFIKNGFLQLSRSINVGGDTITHRIAEVLNISELRAEQFKKDFGMEKTAFLPEAMKPILDTIKNEAKQLLTIYQARNITVNKILIVGGGARLPGLTNFFSDLGVEIELGNPLRSVVYPQAVASVVERYALHLPVAIGLALRNE